jgi:hypothetical protein
MKKNASYFRQNSIIFLREKGTLTGKSQNVVSWPRTKTGILIDEKGRLSSQLQYSVTFDTETLLNPLLKQRIYNNKSFNPLLTQRIYNNKM